LVNFNSTQTDQSFAGPTAETNRYIDWAINEAYREEIKLGRRNVSRDAFMKQYSFTWEADDASVTIPDEVKGKDILGIRDDTNQSPGRFLTFHKINSDIDGVYVSDRDTWGWYPKPSADRELVVFYLASPKNLNNADDEPDLLQEDDQDLLVWSAAILLRTAADDEAPSSWSRKQFDLRMSFWKGLASGRPMINPPPQIHHVNAGR
jgi:hypothetical protein